MVEKFCCFLGVAVAFVSVSVQQPLRHKRIKEVACRTLVQSQPATQTFRVQTVGGEFREPRQR
jgi:hypothetical protein